MYDNQLLVKEVVLSHILIGSVLRTFSAGNWLSN